MADLSAKIAQARKAGYSDAEIANYLGQDASVGGKIATARKSGYSDSEVIGFLARQQPKPVETPQARANRDATKVTDALEGRLPGGITLPKPIANFNKDLLSRARGGSLGWLDEAMGGVSALGAGLTNTVAKATGRPGLGYGMKEAYTATKNALNTEAEQQRKERPVSTFANEVAGGSWLPVAKTTNALKAGVYGAGVGAVSGAGAGDGLQDRLRGATLGAATGFGVGALGQKASNALASSAQRAREAAPSAARELAREGVQLTPGQMMGGTVQRIEDAATSVPILGDAIRGRRIEGIESFNKAAINRVLAPLGETIPENANVGREGVELASRAVSNAYERALAPVKLVPDEQVVSRVAQIQNDARLTPELKSELNTILDNTINHARDKVLTGRDWKMIDADLGAAAAGASNAAGTQPSYAYLANVLKDIQNEWRGVLQRVAPEAAAAVEKANEANANLVRIRQAAQMVGAKNGIFTPSQLNNAVRAGDSSAGNRAFATGSALMQDLTDRAVNVLPSTVPDSGTPIRSAINALGLTGGGLTLGVNPGAVVTGAAVTGAGSMFYSRPVQQLINEAYRSGSPGAVRQAVAQLEELASQNPGLQAQVARAIAELTGRPEDMQQSRAQANQ